MTRFGDKGSGRQGDEAVKRRARQRAERSERGCGQEARWGSPGADEPSAWLTSGCFGEPARIRLPQLPRRSTRTGLPIRRLRPHSRGAWESKIKVTDGGADGSGPAPGAETAVLQPPFHGVCPGVGPVFSPSLLMRTSQIAPGPPTPPSN